MTGDLTFPMSQWAQREAAWRADGWEFISVTTFKSEGKRMAKVTLVKEGE